MSNCIDPNYVELIARNAILKMLSDHTLQAGLRDCACGWIGHETRVVTCDSLVDLVNTGIENGDIEFSDYRVTDFSWDGTDYSITLTTTDQSWTIQLGTLLDQVDLRIDSVTDALRELLEGQIDALRNSLGADIDGLDDRVGALESALAGIPDLIQASRVVSMGVNGAGQLVLTFGDGTALGADLTGLIQDRIDSWANDTWPCGPFIEVEHDGSLSGNGTSCNPLSVNADGIAFAAADGPTPSEEDTLPTTMYGPRTAVLGAPTGWLNIGGVRVPHYGAV